MKTISLFLSYLIVLSLLITSCSSPDATTEDIEENVITEEVTPPETVEATSPQTAEATFPEADIIFINGQIITMEPDLSQAEAIAISGDIIFAVGSNEEILDLRGPETNIVDLGGLTLLPGFVDSHTHLFQNLVDTQGYTLDEVQQDAFMCGTTTIGHMTRASSAHVLDQVIELERQGGLRLRTNWYLSYTTNCGVISGDWYKDYPIITDPTRMSRIIGIKLFVDGGTCDRPAYSVDLPDEFIINGPQGDLYYNEEELATLISRFQEEGYQVATHALGDRGVETVLNAIELALEGQPNTYRHRIEHSATVRPELLSRFGEIGAIPTVTGSPVVGVIGRTDTMWGLMIQQYPETFAYWWRPIRQLRDANPGLPIAWHTDRPAVPLRPIPSLYTFVTRKGPMKDSEVPDWEAAKAITVEEALRMMTIEAAYALFMEEHIGSLKPGKFADLIILSKNPLTIDPDDIINIEVLLTMVGGNVEYYAPGQEALCPAIP